MKEGRDISYHGYVPLLKHFLSSLDHPASMLEVGVDRGVMFLTLATFLVRTRAEFIAVGVDILVQEQVVIMLENLDRDLNKQQVGLIQGNSLEILPKLVDQKLKFDLLLLDGDHNYHTVKNEMQYVNALMHPGGLVVIDDYDGRWSEKDLWYAERSGYESVKGATARIDTAKHGVKPAVDEWLAENSDWKMTKMMQGEPVILSRLT